LRQYVIYSVSTYEHFEARGRNSLIVGSHVPDWMPPHLIYRTVNMFLYYHRSILKAEYPQKSVVYLGSSNIFVRNLNNKFGHQRTREENTSILRIWLGIIIHFHPSYKLATWIDA